MTGRIPTIPTGVDDSRKRTELDRMKFRATALLVGVTLIFIATVWIDASSVWVGLIRATAEASMVGAIADWFAITALFRHPLGIKIPHTAIIPGRKDMFGARLGQFIQQNFLTGDVIVEKIRSMKISRHSALWLTHPENSASVARLAAAGFSGMVQVVRDEDVQAIIERGINNKVKATRITPLIGSILNLASSEPRRQELLYGLVKLVTHITVENKDLIRRKIIDETPWWLPWSLDEKVYQKILNNLETLLGGIQADPDHPVHEKFNTILTKFVDDLKNTPEVIAKGEALKEELLAHPVVQDFSDALWRDIKTLLLAQENKTGSEFQDPLQGWINSIAQTMLEDEVMLRKIDTWVEDLAYYLMKSYGHEIGHLISHTVQQWDAEATASIIELQVGKDLQYIRINGTVVGGLAGLLIHIITLVY